MYVYIYITYIYVYLNKDNCEIDFTKILKEQYIYKKLQTLTDTYLLIYLHFY